MSFETTVWLQPKLGPKIVLGHYPAPGRKKQPKCSLVLFCSNRILIFLLEDTLGRRVCKPPSPYYAYIHRPDKQNISTLLEIPKCFGFHKDMAPSIFLFYRLKKEKKNAQVLIRGYEKHGIQR